MMNYQYGAHLIDWLLLGFAVLVAIAGYIRTSDRFAFRHVYIPFNPKYPNAWRGQTAIAINVLWTICRIQFMYRPSENDPEGIDTACKWNISPKSARWFHVYGYYAGNFRNMYHFTIGRVQLSLIPADDCKTLRMVL